MYNRFLIFHHTSPADGRQLCNTKSARANMSSLKSVDALRLVQREWHFFLTCPAFISVYRPTRDANERRRGK